MNQLRSARPQLSIVLPCFNPRPGWHLVVEKCYCDLKLLLPDTVIELIVVNDGSVKPLSAASKRTLSRRCPGFRLLQHVQNRGKGHTVRKGIREAKAPFVIYTDIDCPYTAADMAAMYQSLIRDEADIITGIREDVYNQQLSLVRSLVSNTCNFLNRKLLHLPFRDVQSGLKGMNQTGRELLLQTTINRFLFDTEFIWLAGTYPNVRVTAKQVVLREGLHFPPMPPVTYLKEAGNFSRILIKDTMLSIRRINARFTRTIPHTA